MAVPQAELQQLDECLRGLVAVMPQDPARARAAMRDLLARDKYAFLSASLPLLKEEVESPGLQYIFVLLLANGLLPPCDPNLLSLEDDIRLARRVRESDPFLDLSLARRFSSCAREPASLDAGAAGRILEVLSAISDHSRILPMLVQMMRHPNARLRSKVALLLARSNRSAQWVEQMLKETDTRIRANAVEALWGVDTEAARKVLWKASVDPNNRVAGNALLGLYRLGETAAVQRVLDQAEHTNPLFRSTAAWVMGETQDPRFLPRLAQMVREEDRGARRSVFRAITRLNKAIAAIKQKPPLQVDACHLGRQPDGSLLLRAAISTSNGNAVAGLGATGLVLAQEGRLLLDYVADGERAPDAIAVGLAVPAGHEPAYVPEAHVEAAVEQCLERKRAADRWAILRFAAKPSQPAPPAVKPDGTPPEEHDTGIATSELLRSTRCMLTSDPDALRSNACSAAVVRPGSLDALNLLIGVLSYSTNTRQLVLLQDWVAEPAWGEKERLACTSTAKLAKASLVTIHAVALRQAPPEGLQALTAVCAETGGLLLLADSRDSVPALCRKLCAHLLNRYTITIHGAGSEGSIKLQVYSEQGYGEDCIGL